MGIWLGVDVSRLGSALFLSVLVAGCGFRSGLDTEDFELVSFGVDQPSYLQGESGVATAMIRNLGPTASGLPALSLRGEGVAESFQVGDREGPDTVEPGEKVDVTWAFTASETAEPGTGLAWVTLVDESGQASSPTVPIELHRAATLTVTNLEFVHGAAFGNVGGEGPPQYSCAGLFPAHIAATVHNSGVSDANIANAAIFVDRPGGIAQDNFFLGSAEANPETIAAGATSVFVFELKALGDAPVANDYWLVFHADVTDATTTSARPDPGQAEALDLPFTVHRAAAFVVGITESVDVVTAGMAPFEVAIEIRNTGTVPVRVDGVPVRMFAVAETTSEYVLGGLSLPFEIAAGGVQTVFRSLALNTSGGITLGSTASHGIANGTDLACGKFPSGNSEQNASEGSWVVQ